MLTSPHHSGSWRVLVEFDQCQGLGVGWEGGEWEVFQGGEGQVVGGIVGWELGSRRQGWNPMPDPSPNPGDAQNSSRLLLDLYHQFWWRRS